MYKELEPERIKDFPFKAIWKSWASSKAEIFAWEATWDRILTLDNVQRTGVAVANRCYLCGEEEENYNHLLSHCGFSRVVLFGISLFPYLECLGFYLIQ